MSLYTAVPLFLKMAIILVPMLVGLIIFLYLEGKECLRNRLIIVSTFIPMLAVWVLHFFFNPTKKILAYYVDVLPPLGLSLRLDFISFYMISLFTFLGFIIVLYSLKYLEDLPGKNRFFSYMLLNLGGCYGVALSGNFFTFFLFFEFMSIIFFLLIVHGQTEKVMRAGYKFLFMAIISGLALFISLVIILQETGTVAFGRDGLLEETSTLAMVAFISFVVAFGIKTALFPLHVWMADAYVYAYLPAAIISSTIMLKTGAYGFLRAFGDIFGINFLEGVTWNYYLIVLACFSILFGSVIALSQDNIIRRLAYSGIAQMGYVVLGMSLLTESALVGATFHIFAHAFMKGTLFLCAGIIIKGTGLQKISEMGGVGYKYPLTMFCFALASLTAVGIPPFNIFVSKWYLFVGSLEQDLLIPVIILVVSSFLNACYYFPIVIKAFWGGKEEAGVQETLSLVSVGSQINVTPISKLKGFWHEQSAYMLLPMVFLTGGNVIFNLMPFNWPLQLIKTGLQMLLN